MCYTSVTTGYKIFSVNVDGELHQIKRAPISLPYNLNEWIQFNIAIPQVHTVPLGFHVFISKGAAEKFRQVILHELPNRRLYDTYILKQVEVKEM